MDKFILYNTVDGKASIKLYAENNTVWLTANKIATLFNITESTSRKHINNIFDENELDSNNNTHYMRVDGVKQPVAFYSLDVILAVGFRVRSTRGTQFRKWANTTYMLTNCLCLYLLISMC